MKDPTMDEIKATLGQAMGRIPSGLAIATAQSGDLRTGFLASWFQQLSFDPPLVGVCIKAGRPIGPLIEASGHFALNLIAEQDSASLKRYGRGFGPGVDPWAGDPGELLPEHAAPVLKDGFAFLLLKHVRTLETSGDHLLYVGEVLAGALLKPEGKPYIHVRKDGFGY
jgi:flavin reductase (DIM6/NTAB) family NADH-FMN oxidoreductase RutF